ncbi:hypothetical protein SO802_006676 [Lithocarpus litseifolius]|uniref:Peptidase S8/S53 domain-containing protein n=1 Tax=Lithocarpus litseifolius TaxID=425828 RepID=A0AAW2DLP9_9ROSI
MVENHSFFVTKKPERQTLAPDLSAPGVDILAAYSPITSPSFSPGNYNIQYGTSTACPHVFGAAAYVKTFHPDWSPSAIKSALMATTLPMSDTKSLGGEFAYGSGHLNPVAAAHPGLVYEALKEDCIIMFVTLAMMQRNFKSYQEIITLLLVLNYQSVHHQRN